MNTVQRRAAMVTASISLLALSMPTRVEAQGPPVDTGSHVPVALWFIGTVVLAVAIIYGIMRNRQRTRSETELTERATRDNYQAESRRE